MTKEEGIVHIEISSLAFKKRKEVSSLFQQHNNHCVRPIKNCHTFKLLFFSDNLLFKTNPQISSEDLTKANLLFVSSDLPMVHHSLRIPNCNHLLFLNKLITEMTGYFIFEADIKKLNFWGPWTSTENNRFYYENNTFSA